MKNDELIKFIHPYVSEVGVRNLKKVLESSHHCGDGTFTSYCSELLKHTIGCGEVLMTSSCTHALELSGLLINLQLGDEVLVPSFAFTSCVNAIILRGASPIFYDTTLDTINIDANKLESGITERTKAILIIHYGGVSCDMDTIMVIAKKYGIPVIEDLAHGPFCSINGRNLGTFGDFATLSFHHTKNFSCGEGGALIVNNPKYLERAEIIREKGTNRSRFMRGLVDKYTWVDIGSSYLPSEFQMAILAGALDDRTEVQQGRLAIWERYFEGLSPWASNNGIALPVIPKEVKHSGHVFYLRLPNLQSRSHFISHMRNNNIECPFHYQALHKSPMGIRFENPNTSPCENAELLSDTLVRLPLWFGLSRKNQDAVIESVCKYSL